MQFSPESNLISDFANQTTMNTTRKQFSRTLQGHKIVLCGWGCAASLLLIAFASSAANITSTTTGGNWSATGTWVGSVVPTVSDNAIIATTGTSQVTVDTTGATAASVTINSGATLGIGTSVNAGYTLTIAGSLTNNGTISTGPTGFSTSPTHTLAFSGNGTWTGSGDISAPKCALNIASGATLDISGLTTGLKFKNTGGSVNFKINGTLIAGTQVVTQNGSTGALTMATAGAAIQTANLNGLISGSIGTFNWPAGSINLTNGGSYVFNGTSAQVTAGLPSTVKALTVNNSAGVTLSASTTVTNLTLTSGQLATTPSKLLTIAASGSVSGASSTSFISGPMAEVYTNTSSASFPVGTNSNYRAVTVNITTLSGTPTITVTPHEASTFGGSSPASTTLFTTRDWTVASSVASGNTATITVDGTGFSPVGTGTLVDYNGSTTSSPTTTFSSPNYSAAGVSLTASSDFALGDYAPGADQLAFTTAPQTATAGVVSGTITVQLQNSGGTPITYVTNYTINLSASSGTGIFRDTGNTTTITSVTILAGNNSASFLYKDTKAGTSAVTASGNGVVSIQQTETTTAASASILVFSTQPVNSSYATTMATVVVQIQDSFGNNVSQSGTPVSLVLNGASLSSGTNPQNTDGTGKATFNDLVISTVAAGLNFTASASGLSPVTSGNFNVSIATITKAANNTAMNTGASWTGGVVPNAGTMASIDNTSVTTSAHSPDIGGSASWYGLQITNWSANTGYTITDTAGISVITLGPGGIQGSNTSHTVNINMGIAFSSAQNWNWFNSSSVNINTNGEGINNNGYPLTLNASTNINFGGPISGAGGITNNVAATVTFTNGNNTFTGTMVIATNGKTAGNATFACPVVVQQGGFLRAGLGGTDTSSTMTINSNLTISGTLICYLNSTNASTASKVAGVNTANLGGTLNLINVGPALQAGNTFTVLLATNYTGSFASASPATPGAGLLWNFNNISVNGTVSVAGLSVSPASTNTCAGNGITLAASAGSAGPFTYQWYDTATNAISSATNASLTLASPATGNYTVVVNNAYGSATNLASVTVNPAPTVSVNSAAVCAGGSAMLTATTSASSPAYLWSPGGATTASITVSPASNTTYTVTVTDGSTGCSQSGSGTVTVYTAATASAGGNQTISAVNSTAGLGGSVGGGATGGIWSSSGTGSFSPNATTLNATYAPSIGDITAGTVTLTLTSTGQSSPCGAAVAQVIVTINPLPVILTGTRLYDSTATAASSILSVSNKSGGDDVHLGSGSATLSSSWVGTNAISSFGTLTLAGTTAPKYTLTGASGAVTVGNPYLPFSITSEYIDGSGNFITVFESIPGVVYQLLGSADASAPLSGWTNVGASITATGLFTTNSTSVGGAEYYIIKNSQ